MRPTTAWTRFFCVMPRMVQGKLCFLTYIKRRLVLHQLAPLRFRYVEEFELEGWPCPPATNS